MRVSKRMAYAFSEAAKAMGWDTGPAYENGAARVGAHFLQRANTSKPMWRVVRIINEGGGESGLNGLEAYTAAEMIAWLEGIAFAKRGD